MGSAAELSSSNPVWKFLKLISKKCFENFKNKVLKTKLVNSFLRTVVVKVVYSATRFV